MLTGVLRRTAALIVSATEAISALLFMAAVLLELVNLGMRWLSFGIPQAAEFSALVMVPIAFLGMARGFMGGEHARFSALERFLPVSLQPAWASVATLLNLVALSVLLWLGVKMTIGFFDIGNSGFSMPWMPLWLWALCLPVGAAASVVALVVTLVAGPAPADPPP